MSNQTERIATALAGRYRLERHLGEGGMATVYLAEDLKHDRKVAVKVLRPELAAVIGAERFVQEIKTTAGLQHPHILPLFDSGESDSFLYYVMPYVEGETLRDRLTRETQLGIDEAVRIATEVADALDYAHRRDVVHRDIKPENILLHDGRSLVADFGIALAASRAGGTRMTETGMSLGTPTYMSPEQAMGDREISARSDVYALGCVLYEMLTGEPPFTGPTAQAIVARVLSAAPAPPGQLRPRVSPAIQDAVLTALEKLPADRFASAAEFAAALTEERTVSHPAVTRTAAAQPQASRAGRRMAVATLVALVTFGAGWWIGARSEPSEAPWSIYTQLTDVAGVETSPSLSPDGGLFAYASDVRGTWDVYVQRVGGRTPVLVAGDSTLDEGWPAFSPDGTEIAYNVRGGGIFVMGATGESPRRLTTFGAHPAWSPDGRQIVFGSEELLTPYSTSQAGILWIVGVDGGDPRPLLDSLSSGDGYQPAWSPGGTTIAYMTSANGQRDLMTISAAGGVPVKVTDDAPLDWAPTWSPDGQHLYFASDRGGAMGLWRIAVDEASGRATGEPVPVASGVDVSMDLPHLSRDGRTLLFRSKIESVNPAAIAFDPETERAGEVTLLQHRAGDLRPTDVSPDGRWLAATSHGPRQDIFLVRTDGSDVTRLTDDDARDFFPRFTSDGRTIVFFSNLGGMYGAWSIRVDGSARTPLTDLSEPSYFPSFTPDGGRLLVSLDAGALIGRPPWPITETTGTRLDGLELLSGLVRPTGWSPDGHWLMGPLEIATGERIGRAVYNVDAARSYLLEGSDPGEPSAWMPDSRRVVYFTRRGALVMQDIITMARREIDVSLPFPSDGESIVSSRDGRTLYYGARQLEANIWVVRKEN